MTLFEDFQRILFQTNIQLIFSSAGTRKIFAEQLVLVVVRRADAHEREVELVHVRAPVRRQPFTVSSR